jgi:ABC-2 type transport system permease protein
LKAFSMAGMDLTTVIGFISMAGIYFFIALSIYSALLGSCIIAKEERDKTAEFFMTLPVSREKVITMKMISGVVLSALLNVSLAMILYLTTIPYDRGEKFFSFMGLLMASMFLVQMFFFGIGLALSSLMKNNKQSGKISIAVLFAMYMLSVFISLSDKIDFLRYLTPFKYFEAQDLLSDGSLKGIYILIVFIVFAAGTGVTYLVYPKRDLLL